jgi:PST family polysaccharide transporter/lipopolysaccharide exporter
MNDRLAEKAGSAMVWKTIQYGGTQTVSLIRLLILARLLVPDDFGLMAMGLITMQTIVTVTDFGMVPALVQYGEPEERHYDAAWTVGFTRGLFIACAMILAAPWIAGLFAEPRATPIIRVLAFRPFLEATASIKMAELTRQLRFRSLAIIYLSSILVEAIVSIVLASRMGVWALVIGALAGAVVFTLMSYVLAPYRIRFCFERIFSRPLIRYGRWIFLTGVVAVSGSLVFQVVISRKLGSVSLGLYYLAVKLAYMPIGVASKMIGEVALSVYARLQTEIQKSTQTFQAILTGMVVILLPVYTLMISLAPSLVHDVLGPRWLGTAPVIRILAIAGLIGFFAETVIPLLKGIGQPYKVTVLEGVQSSLLILLIWWLAGKYGLIGAAFAWLPAKAVSQLFAARFARQALPRSFVGLGRPIMAIAFAAGAGAAIALAADNFLHGITGLILAIFLSVTLMGSLLWGLERRLKLGLTDDLVRAFPQVAAIVGFPSATEG